MDFQNPVPGIARCVGIAHSCHVSWTDVSEFLVPWASRVRELPDEMTGNLSAEQPAAALGFLVCNCVERSAGNVGIRIEAGPHGVEYQR